MPGLITQEEFVKQIKDIEGIIVDLNIPEYAMVKPYEYERLPDDAIVDDLNERIRNCIPPFRFLLFPNGDFYDLKE